MNIIVPDTIAAVKSWNIGVLGAIAETKCLSLVATNVELMPDDSFNIGSKKPIPDLAIEVMITRGSTDKLASYQTLGIPEVWFLKDGTLQLYGLQDGEYRAHLRSLRSGCKTLQH